VFSFQDTCRGDPLNAESSILKTAPVKNRLLRVRELLQRELGAIIARDHAFPGLLVTVNEVDITPDLKHAYVYIGVIGPEHKAERVVEKLNFQHGELQSRVAKRVILKNTPRFHFRLDRSVERGVRITGIMEIIDKQLSESESAEAADVEETEAAQLEDAQGVAAAPPPDAIAQDDDSDDAESTKEPATFPRRTGPRRSPRHFAQHDEE
jgi:ribosome-binding factor A